ncbi:hypothetical protein ANCCAN_00066 [Ancylostoma caninum]|uniref:Uncharacterized protein n=1 Tax=Ancylostoma caninum TaxID=29170 RepID=A0A368HAD8_ANCCA|nr:hypothetical protein ANCCAN_00066 [Ancylostoma caninum]
MLDDQFRMRVDTGCTADSRDSGIDVRSRSRIIPKRVHRLGSLKPVMEDAEEPKWDTLIICERLTVVHLTRSIASLLSVLFMAEFACALAILSDKDYWYL